MIKVNVSRKVFNPVYLPLLQDMSRVQILYGGASSGKSKFKAQQAVIDVLGGGRNYLICRQVARTIRRSVFNEIKKIIADFGVTELFKINKSELLITCVNGYQILFAGLDDIEKLKSITPEQGAITDVWVEEATETERNSIKQLLKRQRGGDEGTPKRLHLTFNPILRDHWIFEDYFSPIGWMDQQTSYQGDGVSILKTWYIHNRFLTTDDVNDLLKETDKYFRDVYTYGNWGVLGNVIFTNWRIEDLSRMRNQFTNRRNGLDFGFSVDPAALLVSHYDRKRRTIYIFDELYETDLTNDVLAREVKEIIGDDRVVCDSAEPKSIKELRRHGVHAVGAKKGKDSILHGVQWLQQQTIIIDKICVNGHNELRQFKWKEDADGKQVRRSGKPVPIEYNDHLISALRYAYEDDANEAGRIKTSKGDFYSRQADERPEIEQAHSDEEINQLLEEYQQ